MPVWVSKLAEITEYWPEANAEFAKQFRVAPGERVKLRDIDPGYRDSHANRTAAADKIAQYQQRLRELQGLLYAGRRHSVLICLHAMDTGGAVQGAAG
jgi:polyphosphate kinase 2 (PPK2 family)